MKTRILSLLVASTACASSTAVVQQSAPDYQRTPPPDPLDADVPRHEAAVIDGVLENGMRIVVVKQGRRPIVMMRLLLGEGAATDPPGAIGATYFAVSALGDVYELKANGDEEIGEKSLRFQVATLGGGLSTSVTADDAAIGIDGYAADAGKYIEMLGAAITEPRHGEETFDARRTSIIHALEDVELGDDEAFFEYLSRAAFGTDHVYARSIYGTVTDLQNLGYEQILQQQQRLLSPSSATLLVVGAIDPKQIVSQARAAFRGWRGPKRPVRASVPPPAVTTDRRVTIIPREPAHSLAICAARPLTDVSASDAALDVLAAILGERSGSRLSKALRGKHGLTYSAHASIIKRRSARSIFACSRVRPDDATRALGLFTETLHQFSRQPLAPEELERAKALLLANIAARDESVPQTLSARLERLQRKTSQTPAQERAAIEAVNKEQIEELARAVLAKDTLRILLAGDPREAKKAIRENQLGDAQVVRSLR